MSSNEIAIQMVNQAKWRMLLAVVVTVVGIASGTGHGQIRQPLPQELRALADEDAAVRYKAIATLERLGKAAKFASPYLRDMLKDPHPRVRVKAAEALWKIEEPPAYVILPTVMKALDDKSPAVRQHALLVVQAMGKQAAKAAPKVVERLADKEFGVRLQAILAVSALGPSAKDATPQLLKLLREDDTGFLEANIATALGAIGRPAVRPLMAALSDKDVRLRRSVAYALGLMGDRAYQAVPALEKALADREPVVRQFSAEALGKIGRDAESALPTLKKALKDSDELTRIQAAWSCWKIATSDVGLDTLANVLQRSTSPRARQLAAMAVADMGQRGNRLLPILLRQLRSGDAPTTIAVLEAIARIGDRSEKTIATIRKATRQATLPVRIAAASAIGSLGLKLSSEDRDALRKGLASPEADIQLAALRVVKIAPSQLRDLTPLVVRALRSEDRQVQQTAAEALKLLNPALARQLGVR